jgi:ABC-type uncharacterized transport system substrate-binding protein
MRRTFAALLLAMLCPAGVSPAGAQQTGKIQQIGYLGIVENPDLDGMFRKGLGELGYVDGKNIHIEYRYAGGKVERLPQLAAELVELKVALIVASGTQAIDAAWRATKVIPIVFPVTVDPVESGYVASLGRPGGNLTGLTPLNNVATAKRVELLKDVMPRISRVALLQNPTNPASTFALKGTEAAARRLGIRLQVLGARSPDDLEPAFRAATREHAGALIVMPDNFFATQVERLVELATKNRLPTIFHRIEHVQAGGLMSYGASISEMYRRAATYVDKILKGAKPAELPVEQPTKFELVINLKTARQLGLTIPKEVLFRADKVIE